jgi:hypothetical protein
MIRQRLARGSTTSGQKRREPRGRYDLVTAELQTMAAAGTRTAGPSQEISPVKLRRVCDWRGSSLLGCAPRTPK